MWAKAFEKAVGEIIRRGNLEITMPDGSFRRYGDGTGAPVRVALQDPDLPRRIVLNPDLGVGEGYVDGTLVIEDDDLDSFMALATVNNHARIDSPVWWLRAANTLRRAARVATQWNPIGRAQANVARHYDLSGALYDLFLDADKQYSCGYFRHPDDTLEQAQAQKKAHIAHKLLIEPGMRVLDIGCGWGGMALTLARDHGARVLGVTLSKEQHKVATRRAQDEGLDHLVEFRLTDYRNVTETFDRIVSVGMFEHVGVPHYRQFFRHVHGKLKPDGVALIHTIGHVGPPGFMTPWMRKYIFPGAYAPSCGEVMKAVDHCSFVLSDLESLRLHYSHTLRAWKERASRNRAAIESLYDRRFFRMWFYYLCSMEHSFLQGKLLVYQFQLAKSLNTTPITRDYMKDARQDYHEQNLHRAAE